MKTVKVICKITILFKDKKKCKKLKEWKYSGRMKHVSTGIVSFRENATLCHKMTPWRRRSFLHLSKVNVVVPIYSTWVQMVNTQEDADNNIVVDRFTFWIIRLRDYWSFEFEQ